MKLIILKHTPVISDLSKWERAENVYPYWSGQHRNLYPLLFLVGFGYWRTIKNHINGKTSRHYEIYIGQNFQQNDKNTIEQKGLVIILKNKGQMYYSMHRNMTKSSPLSYQSSVYQSEETNVVYIIILTDHHLMIMYETPKEGPVKEAKTPVNVYQLKNSFFIFFLHAPVYLFSREL